MPIAEALPWTEPQQRIHPTAIIDPAAKLADDVRVGPYSIIGAHVELGSGCVVGPHVVLRGPSAFGAGNVFFQFSSIGEGPQDLKFHGEETRLEVGDNNVFREYCSVQRGTVPGGGLTRIGNRCLIMNYVHIAHDCLLADDIILVNNTSLAGHVEIDDFAILGGFTLVSQFLHIGAHVFSAMGSVINQNVPPYLLVSGHMAKPVNMNLTGLKRHGFADAELKALRQAYKLFYAQGLGMDEALAQMQPLAAGAPVVQRFIEFIENNRGGRATIIR